MLCTRKVMRLFLAIVLLVSGGLAWATDTGDCATSEDGTCAVTTDECPDIPTCPPEDTVTFLTYTAEGVFTPAHLDNPAKLLVANESNVTLTVVVEKQDPCAATAPRKITTDETTPATDPLPQETIALEAVEVANGYQLEWDASQRSDALGYKVVVSTTNSDPHYPEDGYYRWITDLSATTLELPASDETRYVRIDILDQSHSRIGSSNVVTLSAGTTTPEQPVTTLTESLYLQVQVEGDKAILSWTQSTNEPFGGYKVVASTTNSDPHYPEDGYVKYITARDATSAEIQLGEAALYVRIDSLDDAHKPVETSNVVMLEAVSAFETITFTLEPGFEHELSLPAGSYLISGSSELGDATATVTIGDSSCPAEPSEPCDPDDNCGDTGVTDTADGNADGNPLMDYVNLNGLEPAASRFASDLRLRVHILGANSLGIARLAAGERLRVGVTVQAGLRNPPVDLYLLLVTPSGQTFSLLGQNYIVNGVSTIVDSWTPGQMPVEDLAVLDLTLPEGIVEGEYKFHFAAGDADGDVAVATGKFIVGAGVNPFITQ